MMDSANTVSPEQVVIDNEMFGMVDRAVRGIDLNADTLAIDLIGKVGPGGNYLGEAHTRKFYLSETYLPKLSDRSSRQDWEKAGRRDIVAKASETTRKILREHLVDPLDPDVDRALGDIVSKATRALTRQ